MLRYNYKYINKKNKGQALVLVFFIVMIMSILVAALAKMWQSEIKISAQERFFIVADNLAKAAIEQAKIEVLSNYWAPNIYIISDQNGLDVAGDNFLYLYDIQITNPGGTTRIIKGTGKVLDSSGSNELARRQIQVELGGIDDSGVPDGMDDDLTGTITSWSWQQI